MYTHEYKVISEEERVEAYQETNRDVRPGATPGELGL